jgi:putative SOS response-associated peptidase YedK
MCGRFYLDAPDELVLSYLGLEGGIHLEPRYNIAPSQDIAIVRSAEQGRELSLARWGLVPAWSREEKTQYSMINARADTVADKPAYRHAFRQRRCLIPASGFYEWRKMSSGKQPYRIGMADNGIMAFAGLWEHWEGEGKSLESCSIIVTEANDLIRPVHDRMPVILDQDHFDQWLDPAYQDTATLQELLKPYAYSAMSLWPVSKRVNSTSNDDPACTQAAEIEPE